MNMQIDRMTGEAYDADVWRRDERGLWVNIASERRHCELVRKYRDMRRAKRNENRVLRGKRAKSNSEFDRSARRYQEYLNEDSGERFGDWLRDLKFRRRTSI